MDSKYFRYNIVHFQKLISNTLVIFNPYKLNFWMDLYYYIQNSENNMLERKFNKICPYLLNLNHYIK